MFPDGDPPGADEAPVTNDDLNVGALQSLR
jgi:hypothetical protein